MRPSTLPLRILRKPESCSTNGNSNIPKVVSQLKSLRMENKEIYFPNVAYALLFFCTDGIHNFKSNIGIEFHFEEIKAPHVPEFA